MRVLSLQLDNTNRAIRKLKKDNQQDFMIRILFTNERHEKDFYGP